MISICIPVFNCNVNKLVEESVRQCSLAQIPFEILLIDDFSELRYKSGNRHLKLLENVKYLELEKNIGRSAIRNLFLKYARYNHLLFMDCDSGIHGDLFISRYLDEIRMNAEVVCGGRIYSQKPKGKSLKLRWYYGINRECFSSEIRNKKPCNSFLSNNFLIKKSIFEKIPFDERLYNYGHEDTLFGYRLKQSNIRVRHIDNQLIHDCTETSTEFMSKTKEALKNLYYIYSDINSEVDFVETVKVLKAFCFLKKHYLKRIVSLTFFLTKPFIEWLLTAGFKWLMLFDFYKLGYLCWYSNKAKKDIKPNHLA